VPAFLHKLYNMVGDPSTDPFIRWSVDGNSFLVEGHEEFARLILPRFYKHNTFASFVRQLNMYDFHKVPHLQQGVLLTCNNNPNVEIWEFSSPNFQRSRPDLLILVTRKRNRDRQEGNADPVNLGALVKEISAIKKHQTNITADLRNLHRDNEIIWQETLAAREKHQKHQQVISKILQFLTAVFSN
ncbi:heat shock factor-type transcription factor, partial [Mucor lusitanicus CBS 277.49]